LIECDSTSASSLVKSSIRSRLAFIRRWMMMHNLRASFICTSSVSIRLSSTIVIMGLRGGGSRSTEIGGLFQPWGMASSNNASDRIGLRARSGGPIPQRHVEVPLFRQSNETLSPF
jgi:hypothetical protein